ncbi:putative non-specific serine/threonine protein kinase [Rosa chinensis]|uniref:non-specific serine/threonine protein kinase n=1 Tax=Rosa chinensis TaxID=74649 RepID=A0A2P6R7T6_ROSCH|nr:serine/threonine-protein kinase haspin homolog [Rosa chinensis]PRQ42503.1 putative non-specific serine/threonine protein kinase [Rosa chinensis]
MYSNPGGKFTDQEHPVEEVYRRRKPRKPTPDEEPLRESNSSRKEKLRVSLAAAAPVKRISWNRFLSTRGRTSIAVGACLDYQPPRKKAKRKGRPPRPKSKYNFEKERAYFEKLDEEELIEESPSPIPRTWVAGIPKGNVEIPKLCSALEKWLLSKKFNFGLGSSNTLARILQSSAMRPSPIGGINFEPSSLKTPERSSRVNSRLSSGQICFDLSLLDGSVHERSTPKSLPGVGNGDCEDIDAAVKELSLVSTSEELDRFNALLEVCGQSSPSKLQDVFSKYCDPEEIEKVGEGTYGEAFKVGNCVCKIVPIDGNLRVNGVEVQKRSEELLEEVVLSRTLNYLRGNDDNVQNVCTTFIETKDLRVCQGSYDTALIKAWEAWDENCPSENDHPEAFPENQFYVVFVLEHGGKDLESFVLLNFDEARSLLIQVTAALAVAEAAYEFEHRDLHWGNILLRRSGSVTMQFTLEGKQMLIRTFGLAISIIDFTLSRINTGEAILFLDLSSDPELFNGPKSDKQSETYRKMKKVTQDHWKESFPRTNVLWLLYLVDILLLNKAFDRTSKDERDLRALKKRLDQYQSAREALFDPCFSDLFVGCDS